jgi:hypothetical protein
VENLCDKQGFFCGAKRSKSWTSPDNHRDRSEPQVGPQVKPKAYRDVSLLLFSIATHLLYKQQISKHLPVFIKKRLLELTNSLLYSLINLQLFGIICFEAIGEL